ncbi:MAG: hypothetical protein LIV24_01960 [Eubacterium sp.]|nr:hypothetical protein [Eubacterium sp.]
MRKKAFVFVILSVLIFIFLLYIDTSLNHIRPGVYCVKGMEDVGPQIYLYQDGTGSFCYASASSDWPDGKYYVKNKKVILVDDYTKRKFVFSIHFSGLVYEQDLSAELPYHDDLTAKDGMLFYYNKERTNYYVYNHSS